MMIRVRRFLLLSVALLAGCGTTSAGDGGVPGAPFEGRVFLSTAVTEGGQPKELVSGTRIRLTFDNDTLGAGAGCNYMSGAYRIEGKTIVLAGLATTDMGCPEPEAAQDQWLGGFLGSAPTYQLDGSKLVLTSGQTQISFSDRQVADPDRPLIGTHWTVTSIISGEAVGSIPAGVDAYFVFEDKGTVSGSTGCNQFRGTATESSGTITFGQMITTKMACQGDQGRVEDAVRGVFAAGPVTWKIQADVLTLTASDGRGLELRASK